MFLFKKVDATVLDVGIAYACGIFLMYVVGGIAYGIGKTHALIQVKTALDEDYKNWKQSKKES